MIPAYPVDADTTDLGGVKTLTWRGLKKLVEAMIANPVANGALDDDSPGVSFTAAGCTPSTCLASAELDDGRRVIAVTNIVHPGMQEGS